MTVVRAQPPALTIYGALALIASTGCARSTSGRCYEKEELSPDSKFTATRWCDPCIAQYALNATRQGVVRHDV